jgi:shikimate dehydrogenase
VNITARRQEQADQLAKEFSTANNPILTWPLSETAEWPDVQLIVNTTPAGMSPRVGNSPWPVEVPFPRQALLYDLVYNPAETTLMKAAQSAGLPAVSGLGMLAEQAALAFEIWTGCPIPGEIFRQAAVERMPL